MGTRSKMKNPFRYSRISTKEADARKKVKNETLHIGSEWIRLVDDMSKKSHKRKAIGWMRAK